MIFIFLNSFEFYDNLSSRTIQTSWVQIPLQVEVFRLITRKTRHTDTQTDDTQKDGRIDRQRQRQRQSQTYSQTDRDRQRQTEKQTDRQTDRQDNPDFYHSNIRVYHALESFILITKCLKKF